MTRYTYEAARADGEVVRGGVEAASATDALQAVAARGLLVVGVRERPMPRLRARSPRALAVFFRSLATLLKAGIPLDRALQTGESSPVLRALVRDVRARVREGTSLSSALAAQGGVPRLAVGLVRAGEGAKLDAALEEAARQLEREADLRSRLAAALAYPLVLVLAGAGVVAVLVFSVLPRFVALLGDTGSALPASTRLLLGMGRVAQGHWAVLLVLLVLAGAAAVRWLRSMEGQEIVLGVPGIGSLRFALATARVTRALGPLLATGAPALVALHAAAEAAGDRAVAARLGRTAERVRAGASIGVAMAAERAVQPQAVELIRAGEQAGRLPELLTHAADAAEAEANLLAETGTNGSAARRYTYAPEGVDFPLAVRQNSASFYLHRDGQGNVYAMTDSAGTKVTEYRYRAYGDRYVTPVGESQQSMLTYKGREEDRATGLVYMRNRYYSPRLERFLNEDPIGISGGLNVYAFTGLDPVNAADPSGLTSLCSKTITYVNGEVSHVDYNWQGCEWIFDLLQQMTNMQYAVTKFGGGILDLFGAGTAAATTGTSLGTATSQQQQQSSCGDGFSEEDCRKLREAAQWLAANHVAACSELGVNAQNRINAGLYYYKGVQEYEGLTPDLGAVRRGDLPASRGRVFISQTGIVLVRSTVMHEEAHYRYPNGTHHFINDILGPLCFQ